MEHLAAREGEARERQLRRGGQGSVRKASGNLREDILRVLPTPIVSDGTGGSKNIESSEFAPQMRDIAKLLPTTRAQNGEDRNNKIYERDASQPQNLENALAVTLLPTPIVSDAKGTGPADANRDTTQLRAMNILLPTVTTQESHSGPSQLNRNTVPLNALVQGLLPTPVASEGTKASAAQSSSRRAETGQVFLTNIIHDVAVENGKPVPSGNLLGTSSTSSAGGLSSKEVVLPTPTTNGNDRKGPNYSSAGILQELEIANGILPKEYKDWEHAKQKVRWAKPIEGQTKTKLDSETNWGKFEPAIRRWEETLGRPAPEPTKPDGKDGNHRLSSAFTEWMMGLPSGWITEVGLSRNDELKACGNGVVPQQAELALRALLEGVAIPSGGGQVNLPTPTVSDTFTDNLSSTQQKEGSMHSVTLPQAVRMVKGEGE
tara:strand:+ start:88 stop:1383 length:1296 start_codon:yes stop_codon:yes gene_type:complete